MRESNVMKIEETRSNTFDRRTKSLATFEVGDRVRVQNPTTKLWDRIGTISSVDARRRYGVTLDDGRIIARNRKYLRTFYEKTPNAEQSVHWPNEDDLVDVKEYEPTDDEGEDVNDEQPRRRSNRRKKKPDRFGVKD